MTGKYLKFVIRGIRMMKKFLNTPTNLLLGWIQQNTDVSILHGIKGRIRLLLKIQRMFIVGVLQETNKVRFWYSRI